MSKHILVVGATGKTGNEICKILKARNLSYSVFAREQSASKLTINPSQIKHGDVLNSSDVENAFQDETFTDVIISLGSKELRNTEIRSLGTKHIVDAMKKHQSNATIHVVSALGTGESWGQLNWFGRLISNLLLKSVIEDHNKQEDFVTKSNFPYHILRPVGLKDKPATGKVHVQNEGTLPSNSIQRADVAFYLIESLLENKTGFSSISEKK